MKLHGISFVQAAPTDILNILTESSENLIFPQVYLFLRENVWQESWTLMAGYD